MIYKVLNVSNARRSYNASQKHAEDYAEALATPGDYMETTRIHDDGQEEFIHAWVAWARAEAA